MNESRRMAYLAAMGIDAYASRRQLPGAAPSRPVTVDAVPLRPRPPGPEEKPSATAPVFDRPPLDSAPRPRGMQAARPSAPPCAAVPRFTLVAVVAGKWLWLEELRAPLLAQQVQLVQAMAQALERLVPPRQSAGARPGEAQPAVTRFQWPLHNNRQLDLGEEAARASVAGFVARKLEQHNGRGLVLLGRACAARIALDQLRDVPVVQTLSSAELLQTPALKQQAWRDLLAITRT